MPTYTYAELTDLDWGAIPTPPNAEYWLNSGAEEIDRKIGFVYAAPVVLGNSSEQRPAKLLLKQINAWLAMGRSILAMGASGEDIQLHALGKYYVDEATKALDSIASGETILPGVEPTTPTDDRQTGPMVSNVDNGSAVEAFSDVFGNPASTSLLMARPTLCGNPYTW